MKVLQLPLVLSASTYTQAFLSTGPLRQIVLSRAVTTSLTEALAMNVFDVSALVHEITCDCDTHPYLPVYVAGFVTFSYLYIVNGDDDRLKNIDFYLTIKQNLRTILFTLFLVLGKNVDNAI
jgi:hypothetical protein